MLAIQREKGISASHIRWIKALPKSDKNNLSPLVVSNPNIPLLGLPPGMIFSQTTMPIKRLAINKKNNAVGQVQAIQVKVNPI